MRAGIPAFVILAAGTTLAFAADTPDIKGLWLTTDYPAVQVRAGETTTLPLTIYNYGLAPQRTALTIPDKPADWKIEIDGSGKPVTAAFVDYNGRQSLDLKLTIPASAKPGAYNLTLNADGTDAKSTLPIAIDLASPLATKLELTPKFPTLKGSPKTAFDFDVTAKNDSSADMLVNLGADTPKGFTATFKEQYGTQEIASMPLKAGESKDITVSIKPPESVNSGSYPIPVNFNGDQAKASTKLTLDISGQPTLSVTGENDRLSGSAYAGQEQAIPLTLHNSGTAPATNVSLSASPPSGWKVTFDPKTIAELGTNQDAKVTASVTPAAQAINGDYVVSFSASGDNGVSQSVDYRLSVLTSTLWGFAGVGVIGAALIVLVGAVGRFGRR
ncbi:MAG TPA: NEW3 domain-containing protein [Beijerinckiaceae bacterium]|nr:NEW3 domain-containing protein [Beijerinckiaceae bacterium]